MEAANEARKSPRYMFSGSSNAIAANVRHPSTDLLPDAPSGSLPSIGGHISQFKDNLNFGEIASVKRASIDIIGERRYEGKEQDHYITCALAALEDVNILNVITADAVVGKVTSIYPNSRAAAEGHHPSQFFFSGSHFHNLKVNGRAYKFLLNERYSGERCRSFKVDDHFQESIFEDSEKQVPPYLYIPQLGKIYLGEVDVFRCKATLTMLRVELDSPYQGELALSTNTTNGHDG